jgi:transcriptional regulator with PAS, ATPase and Fis domain
MLFIPVSKANPFMAAKVRFKVLLSFKNFTHNALIHKEIGTLKHCFESILSEAHEGVLLLDENLRILYYNEALTKQYVYENNHLLQQG